MSRSLFLVAAATLMASLAPVAVAVVRAAAIDASAALALGGTVTTLALVCLASGLHEPSFAPLALVTAVCAAVSGLVFARFLGRRP